MLDQKHAFITYCFVPLLTDQQAKVNEDL